MRIFYGNFGSKILFRCGFVKGKYDFPEHLHQFAEICYCRSGSLEITVDGQTETMTEGDMAIIPPYRVHSYYTPDTVERWICVFSDNFIPSFINTYQFIATPKKYVFRPDPELILFLDKKLPDNRESSKQQFSGAQLITNHLIVDCIYEDYLRKSELLPEKKENALSAILLYIQQHYKENLTLSSIGTALGYSAKYVSNCISSIKKYNLPLLINSMRVDYAKSLLINTNKKIIDIGSECGYNNEKSFYRAFESITNMTPAEYRRSKTNNADRNK